MNTRKVPEFEGLRVMLVEDDVLLAMEMEDFLGDLGCEVIGPFGKLDESMEASDREHLDGAVLDLNLRGELSFPLIDKLSEDGVPVIVCSGYVDLPGMKERLATAPCVGKPCNSEALVELMKRHFPVRQPVENAISHTSPVSG
jgi:DNA-binding NtrC family response regulator